MATTLRNHERKPFGRDVVRAWFDTVLYYLLRALDMEADLLRRRNWTWRFRPEGLRSFLPVEQHVPSEAWDNLSQFLSFHSELRSLVDTHDRGVESLLEACRSYQQALVRGDALQSEFRRMAAESPSTIGGQITEHFGAFRSEDDMIAVLAENIVNGLGELPDYYGTARIWNHYGGDLIGLRQRPELRPHHEAVERAGDSVLRAVGMLAAALRETRSSLSIEYDVPIVAGVRLAG